MAYHVSNVSVCKVKRGFTLKPGRNNIHGHGVYFSTRMEMQYAPAHAADVVVFKIDNKALICVGNETCPYLRTQGKAIRINAYSAKTVAVKNLTAAVRRRTEDSVKSITVVYIKDYNLV